MSRRQRAVTCRRRARREGWRRGCAGGCVARLGGGVRAAVRLARLRSDQQSCRQPGSRGAGLGPRLRRCLAAARRDPRRRLAPPDASGWRCETTNRRSRCAPARVASISCMRACAGGSRATGELAASLRAPRRRAAAGCAAAACSIRRLCATAVVLAASDFVLDALVRDPELIGAAAARSAQRSPAAPMPLPPTGGRRERGDFMAALRRWRRAEFARIAWRDLAGWAEPRRDPGRSVARRGPGAAPGARVRAARA